MKFSHCSGRVCACFRNFHGKLCKCYVWKMVPCSAACQSKLLIERTAQFGLLTELHQTNSTSETPYNILSHQSPHPAKGLCVSLHNIITLQRQPIDLLLSGDYLAIRPLTLSGSKVRAGFVEPAESLFHQGLLYLQEILLNPVKLKRTVVKTLAVMVPKSGNSHPVATLAQSK